MTRMPVADGSQLMRCAVSVGRGCVCYLYEALQAYGFALTGVAFGPAAARYERGPEISRSEIRRGLRQIEDYLAVVGAS
jgi:hypothetical protein